MEKNKIDRFIKLQSIQLEILKYFDKVAKQHNITYYLAFGTLLEQLGIKVLFRGTLI